MDEDDWGKVNSYARLDKPETIDAWVSTIFVECYTNSSPKLNAAWIEELAKHIVYALQIINPEAIRIPSDEVPNVLCEVKASIAFKRDGKPQPCKVTQGQVLRHRSSSPKYAESDRVLNQSVAEAA